MKIKIDQEFKSLIPPLSHDELGQLETNLMTDGCRDPLVIWDEESILLDGHNRLEICERRNIPYNTVRVSLLDREAAIAWIEENQLGRRNLTADQFRYFLGRKYERAKRQGARTDLTSGKNCPKLQTADVIAEQHGVSPRTVKNAASYARDLDKVTEIAGSGFKQSVLSGEGELTTSDIHELAESAEEIKDQGLRFSNEKEAEQWLKARRAEKTEERRKERLEKISEISKGNSEISVISRKFPVIYADPPWRYEHVESESRAIENHYPTMSLDEICALDIGSISTDDCVLFLWTTSPKLEESFRVIREWGFTYRTCAVWDKEKIGMGYYFRQQHELLLVATKGNIPAPEPSARVPSVFRYPRGLHSRKPEEVYSIIEGMYPTLPKLELFCRTPKAGWSVWGNQSEAA